MAATQSLASGNSMHQNNKADLLECMEAVAPLAADVPHTDVKIVDGASLVHTLEPKKSLVVIKTFHDYAQQVFVPYIARILEHVTRLDVVWDTYKADSLKAPDRTEELAASFEWPVQLQFLQIGRASFASMRTRRGYLNCSLVPLRHTCHPRANWL